MLIVPISALIGWWIYWYKNDYPDWAMSLRAAVSAARFGVLLIIGLMLLEPFLISMLNDVEKPKLLLYQDVSDSMDSTSSKTLVNLNEKFGNQLMKNTMFVYINLENLSLKRPMKRQMIDYLQTMLP